MPEEVIGKVNDFFAESMVISINLTDSLSLGDRIHIKGDTTDFEFVVDSMEMNNVGVKKAKAGDIVRARVPNRARKGDTLYKVLLMIVY